MTRFAAAAAAHAQLRHSYNAGCERNDHALFHYGFVQDLAPAAPKLAALDLPQGNLYDETLHSEGEYGARTYHTA